MTSSSADDAAVPAVLRVVVVDDNPVVRMGLVQLLEAAGTVEVVAEAGDGQQAVDRVTRHRPDVVLLDVRMPGSSGLEVLDTLTTLTHVLMLTQTDDDETIVTALRAGAVGYLVYGQFDPASLAAADAAAGRGELVLSAVAGRAVQRSLSATDHRPAATGPTVRYGMSEREVEVMTLVCAGLTNPEIAARLFLSVKTVKNHLNRIFAKMSVTSRAQAIARWVGTEDPSTSVGVDP